MTISSKFISVYAGPGSWGPSVESSVDVAREYGQGRDVDKIFDLQNLDSDKADMVIVPGGNAGEIIANNHGANLNEYVIGGGKFFGICAGAIIATEEFIAKPQGISERTSGVVRQFFEEGSLYSATHDMRQFSLAVYPGSCVAPHALPNIKNSSAISVADIQTKQGPSQAFFYSGPAFLNTGPGSEVLATFKDPVCLHKVAYLEGKQIHQLTGECKASANPAAVVFYPKGHGKIVLSSVHPELNPETFRSYVSSDSPLDLPSSSIEQEESRRRLLVEIFKKFNS